MDPMKKLEKQSLAVQQEWERLRESQGDALNLDAKSASVVTAALQQCAALVSDARIKGEG